MVSRNDYNISNLNYQVLIHQEELVVKISHMYTQLYTAAADSKVLKNQVLEPWVMFLKIEEVVIWSWTVD